MGSGCIKPAVGESGCVRIPTSFPFGQSALQSDGLGLSPNDPDCTRLAQHVLVLGPGQSVSSNSVCASTAGGSSDTSFYNWSPPRPQNSEPTCLARRASTFQE